MDARHQLVLMERLGHVVVGAVAETADFVPDTGKARKNQNRRLHLGDAQRPQNFESRHVGKVQVEQNDVVHSSCRRPWPRTRNANKRSKVRVGTTNRSMAAIASAWFRRNVFQLCEGVPPRTMYL